MDKDSQLIFETYIAERTSTSMIKRVVSDDDSEEEIRAKIDKELEGVVDDIKAPVEKDLSSAEAKKIKDLEKAIEGKGDDFTDLDKLQLTLDVTGLASIGSAAGIPFVIGTVADGANAFISLVRMSSAGGKAILGKEGEWDNVKEHGLNMALSLFGLIPVIGDAAVGGKIALKASKATTITGKAADAVTGAGKAVKRTLKTGGKLPNLAKLDRAGRIGGSKAKKLSSVVTKGAEKGQEVKAARAAQVAASGEKLGRQFVDRDEVVDREGAIDVPAVVEPETVDEIVPTTRQIIPVSDFKKRFSGR